jgi:hypothetical protein
MTWRTVKQLLADEIKSVVGSAVSLIMADDVIEDIMVSCLRLPVCGFATPKTRLGTNPICASCSYLRLNATHLLPAAFSNE